MLVFFCSFLGYRSINITHRQLVCNIWLGLGIGLIQEFSFVLSCNFFSSECILTIACNTYAVFVTMVQRHVLSTARISENSFASIPVPLDLYCVYLKQKKKLHLSQSLHQEVNVNLQPTVEGEKRKETCLIIGVPL